ncbi:MAG: nucleotide exchange factor GrpE [candidate division Zixibacteria bacterium]|nr:nucleotide exchange factor GrpE [candidate division Zixibacteria bacterium]
MDLIGKWKTKNKDVRPEEENPQGAEQTEETDAQADAGATQADVAAEATESDESTESTQSTSDAETPDWQDRYLRLAAEFDNFRKRSAREFGDVVRNAERELISDLTEVLDNLDRALKADHKGESVDDFARGFDLIREQFRSVLEKRGLKRMETVGEPFNPEAHDALMRMPSDEHEEGRIVQEVSPGYYLGERVLKHAKVIVSQGPVQTEDTNDEETNES